MHVLVINDDGPPSNQSSPYIHPFVQTLQTAGHTVSVILPHQQRSWIGKAHFVGQVTKPTYFRPGTIHKDDGSCHPRPLSSSDDGEEWVLIDGTPASCAQLGLFHFFQDRPPVDIVVSGPNYGRNTTSLFSLSSGTIGGAMEAAAFSKKAIALSFAFYSRDHDPALIAGACRQSVKIISHLYSNWGEGVDLYSINVPIVAGVEEHKVMTTFALQNYWTSGSSFEEVEADDGDDPQSREQEIRESGEPSPTVTGSNDQPSRHRHRHFKWAPQFGDIQKSIEASAPGNDGWAIHNGYTSVTPLKASYMHATNIPLGEMKLPASSTSDMQKCKPTFYTMIGADSYLLPLIHSALSDHFREGTYKIVESSAMLPTPNDCLLQIQDYESLDFDHLLAHPTTSLANSFIIRKALIRKHHLWQTVLSWWAKHPHDQSLKGHVPLTVSFEVDYAEFLDEALVECWELHESFAKEAREWWVLKPAMSDQGQGVRLFSSEDELRAIFEGWEEDEPSEDGENLELTGNPDNQGAATMTSQLRHFVAQRYIGSPLLFPEHGNRKWHIRSYTLAVGALQVYVYREMLALFAPLPYAAPVQETATDIDTRVHLTNTCLHTGTPSIDSVVRFWDLPTSPNGPENWQDEVFSQIGAATATLFEAAAREQMIHFQPLPNAFEVFGLDWIVDDTGQAWLLEVNAYPDFRQSGEGLQGLVANFWRAVIGVAVLKFFNVPDEASENAKRGNQIADRKLEKVLDIDLGRR